MGGLALGAQLCEDASETVCFPASMAQPGIQAYQ
jgi:hypothetical protein